MRQHSCPPRSPRWTSLGPGSFRFLLLAGCLGAAPPASAALLRAHVSYLTSNAVYLDAGREEGLVVGARGQVLRTGEQVAELEVEFVAAHSASCRVVSQRQSLRQGDDVALALPETPRAAPPPALPPSSGQEVAPSRGPTPGVPAAVRQPPALATQLTGSVSVGVQDYSDRLLADQGYQEGTSRVVLRGKNLFGAPLDLRARLSTRQTQRQNASGSVSDPRVDRLYELSLTHAPKEGRFSASVGRLGAGPFVSVGYLDGVLGQFRVSRHVYFGALAGSRPEVAELGLASIGRKYGGFVRYASRPDEAPRFAELIVAGVGEYATAGEVSREYVAIESRWSSGARWSIFERAEIDFNRDWRAEVAGSASQISNASL